MMRFIMPIILIGISIAVFFMFTNPMYNSSDPLNPGVTDLRAQVASYNQALSNSKALENERDILTKKENAIDPANLVKLAKLLPDNIDNIRLILEIEKIAEPYGMTLKDVKYSTATENATSTTGSPATGTVQGGIASASSSDNKDYGIWDLEFSTTGTYNNFLNFTKDLEKNLRIVDISSIQFSSDTGGSPNSAVALAYKYSFKIKTFWLKN